MVHKMQVHEVAPNECPEPIRLVASNNSLNHLQSLLETGPQHLKRRRGHLRQDGAGGALSFRRGGFQISMNQTRGRSHYAGGNGEERGTGSRRCPFSIQPCISTSNLNKGACRTSVCLSSSLHIRFWQQKKPLLRLYSNNIIFGGS